MKAFAEADQLRKANDDIESASSILETVSLDGSESNNLEIPDARDTIQSLKSFVVNEENMEFFKAKLFETAEYRFKMLQNKQIDLRVEFPYFFTCPELVIKKCFVYVFYSLH